MRDPDLIGLFAQPLGRAGVRYFISGSVAAMLYGEPRFTNDIDLIVFLRDSDVSRLPIIFPAPLFYVPSSEAILGEIVRERRRHFNVIHVESGLKAVFYTVQRDELHAWAFRNIRKYLQGSNAIPLAPPEYVIIRKLEYYREGGSDKHLRDIRTMLSVSGEQIDRNQIEEWVKRLGLERYWKRLGGY